MKFSIKDFFSKCDQIRMKLLTYLYFHLSLEKQPPEVFCKGKVFLEISQNSQENTCAGVSFLIKLQAEACNFIKKETLAQVFSYEFCEISKNTFFRRTPLVAASVFRNNNLINNNHAYSFQNSILIA